MAAARGNLAIFVDKVYFLKKVILVELYIFSLRPTNTNLVYYQYTNYIRPQLGRKEH